jgi:hypothetical protein
MPDPRHRIYTGNDGKAVHVEVDGEWYDGELRSWDQADDGTWSGIVTWRRAPGELLLDRLPSERIREATTPGSRCRLACVGAARSGHALLGPGGPLQVSGLMSPMLYLRNFEKSFGRSSAAAACS